MMFWKGVSWLSCSSSKPSGRSFDLQSSEMVPSQQSWGFRQEEFTPMPVVPVCMVPADQMGFYQASANPNEGFSHVCWQQLPVQPQMAQMMPVQHLPAIAVAPMQQLQPVQMPQSAQLPLQQVQPQMACPSSEVLLDGYWGDTYAVEQCCQAQVSEASEVSTAPSEASPRFEKAQDMSHAQATSASAARRLRRKRAAERKAKAGDEDLAYNFESQSRWDDLKHRVEQGFDLQHLIGHVWPLSQHKEGCRLVQTALEKAGRETATISLELRGHILEAVKHSHANYVVQKAIAQLSVASSAFIVEEMQGSAAVVARNCMGCRTLCRLVEFCSTNPQVGELMDELMSELWHLCCHSFAHHVVQSIMEHGEERHKHVIAETLLADVMRFARHKNSSYLVEKVLSSCSIEDQGTMICTLDPQSILELAKTQYGRHVAKTVLQDRRWSATWRAGEFEQFIQPWKAELEKDRFGCLFLKDMAKSSRE